MENVIKTKNAVIDYINDNLQGYEGYVQFSHRPIDKKKDIFLGGDLKVENEEGFVYEAHFYNPATHHSVAIKQINDAWRVNSTNVSNVGEEDTEEYLADIADFNRRVRMAQVWESESDEMCERMETPILKKVVFAGFDKKGEKDDHSTL